MAYTPGPAVFRFAGDPYVPPAPLLFRFRDSSAAIPPPPPGLIIGVGSAWSRTQQLQAKAALALWGNAPEKQSGTLSAWGETVARDRGNRFDWSGVPVKDAHLKQGWEQAAPADGATSSQWNNTPPKDSGTAQGWDNSIRPTDWKVSIAYDPAPPLKDSTVATRYWRSNEFDRRVPRGDEAPMHHPGGAVAFTFRGGLYTPLTDAAVFFHFYVPPATPGRIGPADASGFVRWGTSRRLDLRLRLPWGRAQVLDGKITGITYPDYDGPVVIPLPDPDEPDILETYMIANSVSLAVLPDRTPLDATGIRISRDADSFAWTLSAQLFGRTSLAQVRPDASGPKEIEATINGHTWLFMVERYSGTGKLADERYSITGVSRSQLLAEPYAPKRSQVNTAPINAEQAAVLELEYTGFTLNWDTWTFGPPDWTMPAGAFSYQDKTAMQVIATLAETVGGVVSPALAADELTILPRYREPVWQWSSAIMDRIIPAAMVSEWGSEWQPQPEWNSCYVSGTTHGVAVDVRRAGTAGDNPAPDVYADWMTGTDAGRARGIAELCKGGNQEIVTLNIPLFPTATAPGLVEPAMLCEVRDVDETWRGLCLGTEISAEGVGASRVKQTLRLERHHREGA